MRGREVLTARDVMAQALVTLSPDSTMRQAMRTLARHKISGAPVTDDDGNLLGILSELDCLQAIASGEFFSEEHYEQGTVGQYMTKAAHTIEPDTGLYRIAQLFLERPVRRMPVVDGQRLLGQVSRRDVLTGIERMVKSRAARKRYPDYPAGREPMP